MITEKDTNDLLQAAKLVKQVTKLLNRKSHNCPTCKLSEYDNWLEYQAHKELTATVKKLENWAAELLTSKEFKASPHRTA